MLLFFAIKLILPPLWFSLMASMPRKNRGEFGCLSLKCLETGLVRSFLYVTFSSSLRTLEVGEVVPEIFAVTFNS